MDFSEFLGKMQKLLTKFEQGDLFGNKEVFVEKSEKFCEEFLMAQGYSVGRPHKYPPISIKSADDLIKMYYSSMRNIFPRHLWAYYNEKQDRAIAKTFIESRAKADGVSYEVALKQCSLIIQTVLDRTDVFKFETAPSFGIFGQAEMGWITERAVRIINKQIAKDEEAATERRSEELTRKIEAEMPHKGLSLQELEEITKRLEDQYGKKEKR